MMVDRFGFSENSQVIEIASNDGYLLQFFKELNIPVLGIEPTKNTAEVARAKGIESINDFFGRKLATELVKINIKADLLLGNNVLAHVPDIVDFVSGMKLVLKDDGVITMEFPHLLQMIEHNEFDTIYHEHFSYLSFYTTKKIFESQGLELFDVEEIPTHGGSLRIYAKHKEDTTKAISENVTVLLKKELTKGINTLQYYLGFQHRVLEVKHKFIDFIVEKKLEGKKIAAYGAAAKGNTLINFCGLKSNEIDFVVDANPHKQNKWLPGSHIPVVSEENLWKEKPDYVVILPWNLKQEIVKKISYTRAWGCKFVTAIPMLEIFEAVAIGL
jgi:SAM-dependent methyltransferase